MSLSHLTFNFWCDFLDIMLQLSSVFSCILHGSGWTVLFHLAEMFLLLTVEDLAIKSQAVEIRFSTDVSSVTELEVI
jgi:hypothetical protein